MAELESPNQPPNRANSGFPNLHLPRRFRCGQRWRPARRFHQLDHSADFGGRWSFVYTLPNLVEHLVKSYNPDGVTFKRINKILMRLPQSLFTFFDVRDGGPVSEFPGPGDFLNFVYEGL